MAYFRFAHLNKRNVNTGDTVKAGDVVGLMGTTGTSTAVHLHMDIKRERPRNHNYWVKGKSKDTVAAEYENPSDRFKETDFVKNFSHYGWHYLERATYGSVKVWHPGWDLNAGPGNSDLDTPIHCPVDGVVIYTSDSSTGFGKTVVIEEVQTIEPETMTHEIKDHEYDVISSNLRDMNVVCHREHEDDEERGSDRWWVTIIDTWNEGKYWDAFRMVTAERPWNEAAERERERQKLERRNEELDMESELIRSNRDALDKAYTETINSLKEELEREKGRTIAMSRMTSQKNNHNPAQIECDKKVKSLEKVIEEMDEELALVNDKHTALKKQHDSYRKSHGGQILEKATKSELLTALFNKLFKK